MPDAPQDDGRFWRVQLWGGIAAADYGMLRFAKDGSEVIFKAPKGGFRFPRLLSAQLAVNLGIDHYGDLSRLHDALTSAGLECGQEAMSLNAAPIFVSAAEFERAKASATEIVARDALTVRLWKSPISSELEVWEGGQKKREEPYKIY